MPRWTPALPLLVAFCLSACDPAPEDPFFAFGSLEAPDGTPVAGTLSVLRGGCGDLLCSYSPPGAPDAPEQEPQFFPFTELQSADDGSWMWELTRFDASIYTQHGTLARSFKLVAQPDPTLPPVEAVFTFYNQDADLPPLRQWDARASVELGGEGDAFKVSTAAAPPIPQQEQTRLHEALPVETLRTGRHGIAFLNAEGQEIWFTEATGGEVEVPLEALEDFAVAWQAVASHWGYWSAPTLLAGETYSTVSQAFPINALPSHTPRLPLSRGAACSLHHGGMMLIAELAPCPLTDGSLELHVFEQDAPIIQVTLDAPAPVGHVTVRGLRLRWASMVRVEAFDGTEWHPVATVDRGAVTSPGPNSGLDGAAFTFTVATPSGLGPVHAVRLQSMEQYDGADAPHPSGTLLGAQEVSLF